MSKQDSSYYIGYKKENLGKIITYSDPADSRPDGYSYCGGQDIFDLLDLDFLSDLVNWLILAGRTHNFTQKEAKSLLENRIWLNNEIMRKAREQEPIDNVKQEPMVISPIKGNYMVLNPPYYSCFVIEPIDYITKNGLNFCQGNVVKYVTRYNKKHETKEGRIMDLKKAISNIEKLIKAEEEANGK